VHKKDAQNGRVCDLCIKKMHRMGGYKICALKRCTERRGTGSVHKKDAQNGWVQDLCIKKMHRKEGYAICALKRCTEWKGGKICALKRCTEWKGMRSVHQKDAPEE
jgi:hypothetical protein